MKTSLYILLLVVAFLNPAPTHAQELKTSEGKIEFIFKASLNDFTGTSEKLNGLINLSEGLLDFYIDLNPLKTGIGLRDKHMRENYLETKEFPFAEFIGKINKEIDLTIG
jgi:polyisoprenoid-binding protein YceI